MRLCPNGFREFLCCCLCQGAHDTFWTNPIGVESAPGLARAPSQLLSALLETANSGATREMLGTPDTGGASFPAITPSISDPSLPRSQELEGRETR
jgi:hypothetical protein